MTTRKPHTKLTPAAYEVIAEASKKGLTHGDIAARLRAELQVDVDASTVCRALGRLRKARARQRAAPRPPATVTPIAGAAHDLSDLEADLDILRRQRALLASLVLNGELPVPELVKASSELRGVLGDLRKALGVADEPMQAAPAGEDEGRRLVAQLEDMAAALAAGEQVA